MNKLPGDQIVFRGRHRTHSKVPGWLRAIVGFFAPPPPGDEKVQVQVAKIAAVVGALAATTWLLLPVRDTIGLLNIGLIYLILVIGATLWAGQLAGVLAAVLGFALFDYFLVPPYLTLVVSDLHNILALFVFLGVSVLISWLIAGAREQARQATQRADDVARLYELSQVIIDARHMEDILPAIAQKVSEMLDAGLCWILLPNEHNHLLVRTQYPDSARAATREEMSLASWSLSHGEDVGSGGLLREKGSSRVSLFAPLRIGQRTIGVLGVADKAGGRPFTSQERRILSTLADQAAVALERMRLLREAERAEVLTRTDQLKSALMSAVSHDLRTPLTSIMTLVTGLLDPDIQWDESSQRDFLTGIYDEAVRLNRIVGNMLGISRIEGGALRPEKEWYSMGEVVESVAQRLEPVLGGHPLSIKIDKNMPLALFDFSEIDQVLTNLIENAAKYTPDGTPITVSARQSGDNLEVTVEDTGPGVPPEHLLHIFDKFYRVDRRKEKGVKGGMGLGLAITKGLIDAHGGRVWATNRPQGGLRVSFTIPVSGSQPVAAGTTIPAPVGA